MEQGAPLTPLSLAKMICKDHGLFIVTVTEKGKTAYVVYRRTQVRGQRNVRLARRTDPSDLLGVVRKLTA